MPSAPDDVPRLRGSRLCEITGVIRQTRDKWAAQGLLREAESYDELDLVEVVILDALLGALKKSHAKIAWGIIRPKLRAVMPGPSLVVVWDPQTRSAELALDDATIVSLVRHGRAVHVVDLGAPVQQAREAFRREVETATQPERAKRQTGRRRLHREESSRLGRN
jgi:hypothetical protein